MNVLIIPAWYPIGEDKLIGVYHKEYAEALAKHKDITVNILFIQRERISKPIKYLFMKKWEVINEKGFNVYIKHMLDITKINFDMQVKAYTKCLDKAFNKYLETNPKPDILHAEVVFPSGYAAKMLSKKYNIPLIVRDHTTKRFYTGKYKKYVDIALDGTYYTGVSKFMLSYVPDTVKCKEVLPNLVDITLFEKKRKKINGLRIVKVGAFRDGKRVEDLLEATRILIDKYHYKDILVTIVGDGYLKDAYQTKSNELKLDDYVIFTGRKEKEEIADILNQNNLCVITSELETFCIPGIEALASGMPIVSTKCIGPEEYIDDKCGILVDVGDIEALAKAIDTVYKNIDNYDIKYLRKVADFFSATAVTEKAINLYKHMIE